jgi:hypothetical protein
MRALRGSIVLPVPAPRKAQYAFHQEQSQSAEQGNPSPRCTLANAAPHQEHNRKPHDDPGCEAAVIYKQSPHLA